MAGEESVERSRAPGSSPISTEPAASRADPWSTAHAKCSARRRPLCGLLLALSVIVTVPEREPAAVGVNVMLMVQLPRPATEPPQVFVCAKSPATTMLLTLNAVEALLLSVTDLAALLLPTATLPKERELLERLARWLKAGRTPANPNTTTKRNSWDDAKRRRLFMKLLGIEPIKRANPRCLGVNQLNVGRK
jgi:hypothetical protein